ncbi:uncharacterized protein LOC104667027 isoform X2 [Rhinopithecus roxellana]|uniref:uncharacterized protein LOC104667027 isoform X2 n=1 Tax=Rhinopithecus roxellana TaxID=61622 RepID=UPI0012374F82|nr:uncharacterized protein LOC104667027 isoform X2 [Rhinopithecus roxellana]
MESWWGLPCLAFLCFLMHARGQRDFDLADALDDPEPTKKPNSVVHFKRDKVASHRSEDGERRRGGYQEVPRPLAPSHTAGRRPRPIAHDTLRGRGGLPSTVRRFFSPAYARAPRDSKCCFGAAVYGARRWRCRPALQDP